jgi:hypothetical protein
MAQITFNLSKTSRDPGWDPSSEFHDELWQSFAAGYKYRVVGGNGTVFDSLRGSDPATRGTSDTFDSSAGSLDLTASNFSGLEHHQERLCRQLHRRQADPRELGRRLGRARQRFCATGHCRRQQARRNLDRIRQRHDLDRRRQQRLRLDQRHQGRQRRR